MKTRIISAAVAIVIAVALFWLNNYIVFSVAVALLTAGMMFEIFKAADCMKFFPTSVLCMAYGLGYPFLGYMGKGAAVAVLALWLAVFASYLYLFRTLKFEKLAVMAVSAFFVTYSMNCLLALHKLGGKHGLFLLILTLCGAWLADSGAYFAGTFFGKHKLCPNISPKKTVEGFVGGTVTNGLIFIIAGIVYGKLIASVEFDYFLLFLLGMCCSAVGLLGDLTASLIKRQYGIKDYGNIMPGHGGVMDRFDSVLFVAPFMMIMLGVFNIY